jgi:Ca2+-binding RTX toxin-like protein
MATRLSSKTVRHRAREPMAINPGTSNDDVIVVESGAFNQTVDAGLGNDIIIMDWSAYFIRVNGGDGTDTIRLDARAYTTNISTEQFRLLNGDAYIAKGQPSGYIFSSEAVERFIIYGVPLITNYMDSGSGDDELYGGNLRDDLYGRDGNDFLDGGAGDDLLDGGAGDDLFIVDSYGDVVEGSTGIDEVRTALGDRTDPSPRVYVLPATVEKLTGTLGSAQLFEDNALDNVIVTSNGADFIYAYHGGNDTIRTGGGNDFLFFGATFDNDDTVVAGHGTDRLGLYGDYVLTFAADSLDGIERLMLYSAAGNDFDYDLTVVDANVAAGTLLEVAALSLGAGETLAFNGAAETDGSFWIRSGGGHDVITGGAQGDRILGFDGNDILDGGGGNDILTGGLGKDLMNGGAGADRFVLATGAHSVGSSFDVITGFDSREDRIDVAIVRASVAWAGGPANVASFESDLLFTEIDVNFDAGHHVLFVVTEGDMANRVFFLDDSNADGAFTPGVDLVVELASPIHLPLPDGPEPLPATFVI